ncbi:MAG TPA: ABC transporter ATP-binding protein [Firmicutes bacterium]|nr:ABC transporter ATP-binding protein [Bacillota bacterium]
MVFMKNKQTITPMSKQKAHPIMRLLRLTRPFIGMLIIAMFCALMVNLAQLLKPYILKVVIDDFLVNKKDQVGWYSISVLALSYFLVVMLGGLFSILQANIINRLSQGIMKDMRTRVFKVIQYLPLWYLDSTSSGRLITRATNDVEALSEMYTDVILNLFKDIVLLIGIVYAMFALDARLALVSFIVVPVMFFIVFLLKKKIKANFQKMKHIIGQINGFMAENISGMKTIQIFRGEREKYNQFLKLNDDYFHTTIYQVRLNGILRPAADVFQTVSVALLIAYAMGKISDGTLEIGVLYAFTTYIKQFFNPISDLAENYTTIQSALVSAERIFDLVDQEPILETLDDGLPIERLAGEIEFRNVWFAYKGEEWILKNVSFKVKPGQTCAFVGETGAGKTTIISLISGFYQVNKGEILLDGININDYKLEDLRRHVAVVLQDVFLFSGTVKENIVLNDDITDTVLEDAIYTSCAKDFIDALPNELEEPVMERGNTFSAGQKQLLSFARALAHEPTVLVLDEATANIDTHTEKLIQQAVENVSKERTTLVIAHRLSTIQNSDQIIVLKYGEIKEVGNHQKLVEQDGYYANLIKSAHANTLFE